ncbi:MAG: DUF3309 domain-containing protein [Elusimicrobiota bacterium]
MIKRGAQASAPTGGLVILTLILALVGTIPAWPHSAGWGYYPSGLIGLALLGVLVFSAKRKP